MEVSKLIKVLQGMNPKSNVSIIDQESNVFMDDTGHEIIGVYEIKDTENTKTDVYVVFEN